MKRALALIPLAMAALACGKPESTPLASSPDAECPAIVATTDAGAPSETPLPTAPNENATNVKLNDAGTGIGSTARVAIDFNRRVKMRDGVELSVDVYRPVPLTGDGPFPVIMFRTPYMKTSGGRLKDGRYYASHGYVYLAMDVRGRGDSDGTFYPYVNDGQDGYDAIEWAAKQPWSNGKVGTLGGSYPGRIQWLAALKQPPHLTSMVALVTPSDPFVEWPTGLPIPLDISWHHFTSGHANQNGDAVDWAKVMLHLPIATLDEAAGRYIPAWKDLVQHPQLDSFYEPLRYQNAYAEVKLPVFHISGWYDDEQIGTPLNFSGMVAKAPEDVKKKQRMLMGPWGHGVNEKSKLGAVDFGKDAVIDLDGAILRFFDATLKGEGEEAYFKEPGARIFVMGDNRWTNEAEWPLARTRFTKFYLHGKGNANTLSGDGALSTLEPGPPAEDKLDKYKYDPQNPTPFLTEQSFAQIGGPDDYRAVEKRADVLVYTSEPLKDDLTVCGPIKMELFAASSAKDTDFMAKLLDVWPDGFAQRLTDGMVRARFRDGMERPTLIQPAKIYPFVIDMWNTCQTFKRRHQVRIEIASSAFPKYDRNPNTGEPLGLGTKVEIASQTIYHDTSHPSHVVLPVIPTH